MSNIHIGRSLTVYLLTPESVDPLEVVTIDKALDFDDYPGDEGDWLLFVRNVNSGTPDWAAYLRQIFAKAKFSTSASVSALLLIPHLGRLWAITFGRGRFILREGAIEERFGLRCALNAIDPEKIRAIDKEIFDAFASQSRQQAVAETQFANFGVNVDRDLLYAVTGKPRDERLGNRLAGKDALCASKKIDIDTIPDYLTLLYSVYTSDAYQEKFRWVDNIYEVRVKGKRRELDSRLIERLRVGDTANAWLSLPEVLDWETVKTFSYSSPSSDFMVDDIHLRTYLSSLPEQEALDLITLKKGKVVALDDDRRRVQHWSLYKCLYAEIVDGHNVYLLTNGHWYRVNREIVDDIKSWYDALSIDSGLMPQMLSRELEDSYNKRIGSEEGYHCFHGRLVRLPANRGVVEFCDLGVLRENGYDLVHVKRFGQSSKLSHLFFQGMNSAKLMRTSPEFRNALFESVAEHSQDSEFALKFKSEPQRGEYRVVFAISSSSVGRLEIPLFSKLSLRQAMRELEGLGFEACLAKISTPEEERKLLVKKSKKVRKTF